ncbi:hypothetical protein AB0C06_29350 [Micromonospora inaquosa]
MRPDAEPNEDEERPAGGPDLWQLAGLPGGMLQDALEALDQPDA